MPDSLHFYDNGSIRVGVALPFDPARVIADWERLQAGMIRQIPPAFTRDEWAYLIGFLDRSNLDRPFREVFGRPIATPKHVQYLMRRRAPVAVWLPNNVSLIGTLMTVLISLAGCPLRIKIGSRASDLTAEFLNFARKALPEGDLRHFLSEHVELICIGRDDPRNAELSAGAALRIIFGSDAAVRAISSLPSRADALTFAFADHVSEAWIEPATIDEPTLTALVKVFSIYGNSGCTSPRRVVVLGGEDGDALRARDSLVELWPRVTRRDYPMHIVSENLAIYQATLARGGDCRLSSRNSVALLAAEEPDFQPEPGTMALSVVATTLDEAVRTLSTSNMSVTFPCRG